MSDAAGVLQLSLYLLLGVVLTVPVLAFWPKPWARTRSLVVEVGGWFVLVSVWTTILVLSLLFTVLPALSGVAVLLLLILAGLAFFGLARFARARKALSALLFTQGACFGGYALALLVVTLLVRLHVL